MSWTRLGRRLVDFEVKLREVLFVNPAANALRGGHRPHSTTTPLRQGQVITPTARNDRFKMRKPALPPKGYQIP